MASKMLRALTAGIALARARSGQADADESAAPGLVLPARGEIVKPVNCTACGFRFDADALGDAGDICCDSCARHTCPNCRHVFFRALPGLEDKPPAFFRERRHAHDHRGG